MEAIIERCCGLDVHQATVVACVIVGSADRRAQKQVRTFGTTTRELLELGTWLREQGCTHAAMEGTGVYWKPVHAVLDDGALSLVVANARHIKKVPGRKTDVLDSEWIAQLLRHGLIKSSFVPPKPIQQLRDLVRYRKKLVQTRSTERNRAQKLLESANIKLASVLSDVFGTSGMEMLRALLEGVQTPAQIAQCARGRARSKLEALEAALEGRFEEHHRFVLRLQLGRLERVDADIETLDARIEAQLATWKEQRALLQTIPGVSRVASAQIVAEIGVDMSAFDDAAHLASWAGICPGSHESAGKNRSGKLRKGNRHLTVALVEAAQAAARSTRTYLRDKFHKLRVRRGYKRAVIAIAHKILIAAYRILRDMVPYRELGEGYLDSRSQRTVVGSLVHRLKRMGYEVALTKPAT
jgi:transposase